MKKISWLNLLFFILVPIIISFIIQMLIPDIKTYYDGLKKPFNVPHIVFPIVWTILYVLIGISAYLVFRKKGYCKEIRLHYLQMFFNLTWTLIFFGFHLTLLSVVWIVILLVLACITAIEFYKTNKISGLLFIPYIIWLLFATYLNIAIYILK